jgi:hypothetical protein
LSPICFVADTFWADMFCPIRFVHVPRAQWHGILPLFLVKPDPRGTLISRLKNFIFFA